MTVPSLSANETFRQQISAIAEGSTSALPVLALLVEAANRAGIDTLSFLQDLDDMNVRGLQVLALWETRNYFCPVDARLDRTSRANHRDDRTGLTAKQRIADELVMRVVLRDPELVDAINCYVMDTPGLHSRWAAVERDGLLDRPTFPSDPTELGEPEHRPALPRM